jgi:hypothetical protein
MINVASVRRNTNTIGYYACHAYHDYFIFFGAEKTEPDRRKELSHQCCFYPWFLLWQPYQFISTLDPL